MKILVNVIQSAFVLVFIMSATIAITTLLAH